MPAKVGQLELDFLVNLAQFQGDLNKSVAATKKAASDMQRTMSDAAKGIALSLATVGAAELFKGLLDNVSDAQNQMAQVQASLKSTGGAAGVTAAQVDELAKSIKKMSSYDDDAIKGMEAILLTFTKVGKDVFPQATQAIVDMSTKLGQDLKSSAIQVGKALNDPVKGLTALQRVGVSFGETQKAMIKSMVDSGKTMDAQKVILRELATEFGGSAAAARNTLGGALQALQVSASDLYKAIGGDGSSLRLGVEVLIVAMDRATTVITDMGNPTTKLGKQVLELSKDFAIGGESLHAWLNLALYGADVFAHSLGGAIQEAIHTLEVWDRALSQSSGGAWYNKLKEQIGAPLEALRKADEYVKQHEKSGALPNYLKGVDDIINEARKNMDALAKATNAYKGPGHASTGDAGLSPEEQKALDKQRQTLQDILSAYQARNRAIAAQTIEQKALNDQLEVEHRISALTSVPLKERLAALLQIKAATKERIDIENQEEIGKQRTTLQEILSTKQKELEVSKNKTQDQEELNILLAAEDEIRKATKDHATANLDIQNQILDVAKKQMELAKQEKHDAALKTLQGISKEYDDEYQSILDQINGTKKLNKLEEDSLKIQQTKGLSEKEKADAIAAITAKQNQISSVNAQYQQQEQLVNDIINSDANHADKVKALQQAYDASKISAKGWADGMNQLGKNSKDATGAAQNFVSILSNGLNSIFSGGQKVTDVFKSMGKELLQLATKTLLLDPLEKGLTKLATNLFGGGASSNSATANNNLPPGVYRTPSGQYTTDPNYSTYWPSALQGGSSAGSTGSGSGILGGLMGSALGLAGMGKGAKGLLGNLFGSGSSSTSSGIFGPGGQALGAPGVLSSAAAAKTDPFSTMAALVANIDKNVSRLAALFVPDTTPSGLLNPAMGGAYGAPGSLSTSGSNPLSSLAKTLSASFGSMFDSLSNTLKSALSPIFGNATASKATGGTGLMGSLGSSLLGGLGNLFSGGASGIPGILQLLGGMNNAATGAIGSLFGPTAGNLFSKITSPAMNLAGSLAGLLRLPAYATGTDYHPGGWALVGDDGPELVNLPQGSQVMPNWMMNLMGSGGGPAAAGAVQQDLTDPSNYNFRNNWGNNGIYGDPYYDGFQKDLATVDTAYKQALARQYIQQHKGEDNFAMTYWTGIANNQWGAMGSPLDIVTAGGHTDWGEGNQHMALINKYKALNIPVPARMEAAAKWADQLYDGNPVHMTSVSSGYGSMGMGAGDGGSDGAASGYGVNEGFDYSQAGKQVGHDYIGASADYRNNISGWSNFADNMSSGGGLPSLPGADYARAKQAADNPSWFNPFDYGYDKESLSDHATAGKLGQTFNGGSWGDLSPAVGGIYGAPGTLSMSNTGNDIFAYTNDTTMAPQRKYTSSAKFYTPQIDAFTAGQINGLMLGGPRANGGPVNKNSLYQVNERGDEMFVPDSAGKIYPLKNGTDSSGPKVTVHNYAGVDVQQETSANGRDVTFVLKSLQAQDNVNGYGARILANKYGLQQTPTRKG